MQTHILSIHTPSAPVLRSKGQNIGFSLKVIMLHIKLKGMEQSTMLVHNQSLRIHFTRGSRVKTFVLIVAMLHIK